MPFNHGPWMMSSEETATRPFTHDKVGILCAAINPSFAPHPSLTYGDSETLLQRVTVCCRIKDQAKKFSKSGAKKFSRKDVPLQREGPWESAEEPSEDFAHLAEEMCGYTIPEVITIGQQQYVRGPVFISASGRPNRYFVTLKDLNPKMDPNQVVAGRKWKIEKKRVQLLFNDICRGPLKEFQNLTENSLTAIMNAYSCVLDSVEEYNRQVKKRYGHWKLPVVDASYEVVSDLKLRQLLKTSEGSPY